MAAVPFVTADWRFEWRRTFVYFDADKDDNLSPEEFYSCTTGIGLVLSEDEMGFCSCSLPHVLCDMLFAAVADEGSFRFDRCVR